MYPINLWSLGSSISLISLWEDKYNLREDIHSLDPLDTPHAYVDLHEHNQ